MIEEIQTIIEERIETNRQLAEYDQQQIRSLPDIAEEVILRLLKRVLDAMGPLRPIGLSGPGGGRS